MYDSVHLIKNVRNNLLSNKRFILDPFEFSGFRDSIKVTGGEITWALLHISKFDQLLENDNSVTIHHRNIQALATEIYKTLNDLNPLFMKEVFSLKAHRYPLRTQNLIYPNPRTVLYGLEFFGYRGSQIWKSIPREIQESEDISVFKTSFSKICKDLCKCNLCKLYISNLGYIERSTT